MKFDVLGVPEGPVVTAEAAEAMAVGARRVLRRRRRPRRSPAWPDRPSRTAQQPGTVFVGLAMDDDVESIRLQLPGDRERVRQFATISALDLLRHRLTEFLGQRSSPD